MILFGTCLQPKKGGPFPKEIPFGSILIFGAACSGREKGSGSELIYRHKYDVQTLSLYLGLQPQLGHLPEGALGLVNEGKPEGPP